MRILQICTAFYHGGIQKHVMELSESLLEKGHEVFLAGEAGTWLDESTEFNYQPLEMLQIAKNDGETANIFRRLLYIAICASKLRRFIRKNSIELIHAHETAPAIVSKLAALGLGLSIVVTYHGSSPGRVKFFGQVCRWASQLVITPSHKCAEALHDQANVPTEIIKVLALGVQPPPIIEAKRVKKNRQALLGSKGKILVIIVARLEYQKGIDILIQVVNRVKSERDDIRFIVVGDGPLRADLEERSKALKVDSVLQFVGATNEPYLYLMSADIFLLTSRWEALPITIAEAFQVGLPVIATDTGGVTELVGSDVGYVQSVGDVEALSTRVLELCNDGFLRKKMSEKAIEISRENRFSIPFAHNLFEETYKELLGIT